MKRIEFFITPERKEQVRAYCKQRKITQSRLMLDLLSMKLGWAEVNLSDGKSVTVTIEQLRALLNEAG